MLPLGQVEPSVTLDDILSTLDPKTRANFQIWMQSLAEGLGGRGEEVNAGFAELQPLIEDANKLVTVANSQEGALRASIHNTGVVFDALTAREGQFRGFIENGERTFHAIAQASQQFAQVWREFPQFERGSQTALRSVDQLATDTVPFYNQFRPAEEQLTRLLRAVKPFTPEFDSFLTALGPFAKAAKTGLPAVKKGLQLTTPMLAAFTPVLRNFDPFLEYLSEYVPELQSLFANGTASTLTTAKNKNVEGPQQHFLKVMNVLSPEGLSVFAQRVGTNRGNPYPTSDVFNTLATGLPVFSSASCANSAPAATGPPLGTITQRVINQLIGRPTKTPAGLTFETHILNNPRVPQNQVPAPTCKQQGPFTFNGVTSQFPHVTPF